MEQFTVILLAGDRPGDALAEMSPYQRKVLLPLRGRAMILYVLDTLTAAPFVGEVVVVANDVAGIAAAVGARDKVRFREGAEGPAASVLKACETEAFPGPVLVATADSPLLRAGALAQFCGQALKPEHDVCVGLAREKDVKKAFPDARRTFFRMRDGGYSGCNLFAGSAAALTQAAREWTFVEATRKRPLAFIAHFGWGTLIKALCGMLSLEGALKAVSRTLGVRAGAVILDDPLAAMDVDRIGHVAIAEAVLAQGLLEP